MMNALTNVLHQGPVVCSKWIPNSIYAELYSALVCGTTLPAGFEKQVFLDSGLIHLMVVSGAHLLFLESMMERLPVSLRLPLLGGYCWLTGFGAPIAKAFARRLWEVWLRPLGWSGLQIDFIAVASVLCIWPPWILSRSLQMSWMCGLALSLSPWFKWRAFDQSLKAYLLLFVFAAANPVSIAWNCMVAPFVGMILFPMSLACFAFEFLVPIGDALWGFFLLILRAGPKFPPVPWFAAIQYLFWLAPLLHLLLLRREIQWRRAHAYSC